MYHRALDRSSHARHWAANVAMLRARYGVPTQEARGLVYQICELDSVLDAYTGETGGLGHPLHGYPSEPPAPGGGGMVWVWGCGSVGGCVSVEVVPSTSSRYFFSFSHVFGFSVFDPICTASFNVTILIQFFTLSIKSYMKLNYLD